MKIAAISCEDKILIVGGDCINKEFYLNEELTIKEAEDLIKQLKLAVSNSIKHKDNLNPLPIKVKNAANRYMDACIWSYQENGYNYDHAPIFGDSAREMCDEGAFKDLSKEQLTCLFKYILEKENLMDLPLSVLASELIKSKMYSLELINDIIDENIELVCVQF
jgi:hypothetical protein